MSHFLSMTWCIQLLTHTIYCLKEFLQSIELERHLFSLFFSSAKERRPHPADSALKVHGEITLRPSLLHAKIVLTLSLLANINYKI